MVRLAAVLAGVSAVAGLTLVSQLPVGLSLWPLRLTCSAALVALTVGRWREGVLWSLVAPLPLLGAIVVVAYSLVPALFAWAGPPWLGLAANQVERNLAYAGSSAEALVLAFAALCFAVEALSPPPPVPPRSRLPMLPALILAVLCSAVMAATPVLRPVLVEALGPKVAEEALLAARPLATLAMAAVVLSAPLGRLGPGLAALGVGVLVLAAAGPAGASKLMVITGAVALLALGLRRPIRGRYLLVGAGVATVLTLPLVVTYHKEFSGLRGFTLQSVLDAMVVKGVYRQGDTGYCLDRVLGQRLATADGAAFGFASVLVPRALWPEKPVMSRGDVYSDLYCPFADGKRVEGRIHSASITLLGEPLEQAGWAGVAAGMATVLALAVIVGRTGRRSAAGAVFALASLPWMVDFDQHTSLWLGNLVKAWLVMVPVMVAVDLLGRGARRRL